MVTRVVKGSMSPEEIQHTVQYFREKYPEREYEEFEFSVDGDYVDVKYTYHAKPFERIRRITGYLVGTLNRFNDAKRSEVEDRVKHSIAYPKDSHE